MKKRYSPLIGAALATASLFQFSLPTFAAGTAAGTVLRNTATGSYQDDAGNPYTIESNTVDVTIAKVAGITNQPSAVNDDNGGNVLTGDTLEFIFEITNVGNDLTNIFVPDVAQIAPNTSGLTTGNNGDALTVEVSQINPDGSPTFVARPGNGIIEDVPINGKVLVKVIGEVSATAAGAPIEVLLGDTPPNEEPNNPLPETQNQPDAGGNGDEQASDVRTETATNPTVANAPVDGQREASALQQVFLGSNPLAMARIEKVRVIDDQLSVNTDADLTNNVIAYNLDLEVLNTTPNARFIPGELRGRDYSVAGTAEFEGVTDQSNLVLISDAIPANTELQAPISDNGQWTAVYSTETDLENVSPDEDTTWTTTAPTTPAQLQAVTRVGWVYDAGTNNAIAPGDTIPTFNFSVTTTGLDATTGGTVANIAQVFGSTVGSDSPVFDESGDQNPTNFNDDGSVGPDEEDPQSTGVANPGVHDVDNDNDNTATGSIGGEDNVIIIGTPGDLLNGPAGDPAATGNVFGVGPDNDHDFQNLGVDNFPENAKHDATPPTTFDPNVVTFTNTLSNPGTEDLNNVLLQPINPEFDAGFAGDATDEDLPFGTTVTLTLGGQTATYTYREISAADPADPSTGRFDLTDGQPIEIPTLAGNTDLEYTADVDLPPDTGLSTDTDKNGGFPVPIIAFIDDDADGVSGSPDPATERFNVTVNQVYTGFVKVTKQVRVIDPDGSTRARMNFGDPDADKAPRPGDTLEYRVIYRNISEPQAGVNSVVLNGNNVTIAEDGTLDAVDGGGLDNSGNNWALDNNGDTDIDTINVQNTAADTNNGTITFFTGTNSDANATPLGTGMIPAGVNDPGDAVTGYRVEVEQLPPVGAEEPARLGAYNPNDGDSAFTFQRVVDDFDGLDEEGLEVKN